jgi:hypothetical protein
MINNKQQRFLDGLHLICREATGIPMMLLGGGEDWYDQIKYKDEPQNPPSREEIVDVWNNDVKYRFGLLDLKHRRNRLLETSDWVVTRSIERGEEIPQEWRDYRQALRDITIGNEKPEVDKYGYATFRDITFPTPPA